MTKAAELSEVSIESFKDKSPTLSVIDAIIWTSKSTQKAILIGRNGNKLKELGTTARKKLEEFWKHSDCSKKQK